MPQNEFIPRMKLNKRQRAALDKQKRIMWGFSPVNRIKPSAETYSRKKKMYYE